MYSNCEKCGEEVSDVSMSPSVTLVLCKKCDSISEKVSALPSGLVIDMDEERKK